ncbi:MAG: hypothetical protein ACYTDW_18720 [Planctomycetota bacterium]
MNAFCVRRTAVSREKGLQFLRGLEPKSLGMVERLDGETVERLNGWTVNGKYEIRILRLRSGRSSEITFHYLTPKR